MGLSTGLSPSLLGVCCVNWGELRAADSTVGWEPSFLWSLVREKDGKPYCSLTRSRLSRKIAEAKSFVCSKSILSVTASVIFEL